MLTKTHRQDQILQCNLNLNPLLVGQGRPDEVRLSDSVLVRTQNDLGLLIVDVQTTKEQNETRERRVARDGLEPVVVQVE